MRDMSRKLCFCPSMTKPSAPAPAVAKRGPKPAGDRALTAAERKRRSRQRLVSAGDVEIMVRLKGGIVNLVDQLAAVQSVTRSEVVEGMLDMAVAKMVLAIAEADELIAAGATDEEVAERVRAHIRATPEPHLVEKFKEVAGLQSLRIMRFIGIQTLGRASEETGQKELTNPNGGVGRKVAAGRVSECRWASAGPRPSPSHNTELWLRSRMEKEPIPRENLGQVEASLLTALLWG